MAPNLESVVVGRDCRLGRGKGDPRLPSPKSRPVLSVYVYILNVFYVLCSSKDYLEHHQKFTVFTSERRFDRAQNILTIECGTSCCSVGPIARALDTDNENCSG